MPDSNDETPDAPAAAAMTQVEVSGALAKRSAQAPIPRTAKLQFVGVGVLVLGALVGFQPLTIAAAIVTGIATALNLWQQAVRSKQTDEFQDRVRAQQEEIAEQQGKISQQQARIGEQQDTIKALNDEIKRLTLESHSMITGGDSYVYLMPLVHLASATPRIEFIATCNGAYPVYDVSIDLTDQRAIAAYFEQVARSSQQINLHDMRAKATLNTSFPSLHKGAGKTDTRWVWSLNGVEWRAFTMTIYARNGMVSQVVGIRRVGGRWLHAYRVTRSKDNAQVVLEERIPDDYPRKANGDPIWEGDADS